MKEIQEEATKNGLTQEILGGILNEYHQENLI